MYRKSHRSFDFLLSSPLEHLLKLREYSGLRLSCLDLFDSVSTLWVTYENSEFESCQTVQTFPGGQARPENLRFTDACCVRLAMHSWILSTKLKRMGRRNGYTSTPPRF